jgi:SAM-dependent methyltransferase
LRGVLAWAPELAAAGGGFKAEYFAPLARLEERNFWFQARNALVSWALRQYFPAPKSLLEVGCGTGFVLSGVAQACPDTQLLGSEIFIDGLSFAAERVKRAAFVQMDARRIPYVEEFDVVAAFDVIEHIEEDELVLRNFWQALKPGGGVLLTVPQHQWLWSESDKYACHVRRYSAGELHAKLERAGFDVVRSTSFTSLLLPAMMLSRRKGNREKAFDPMAEFNIPRALNWAMGRVLDVERWLVRLGVNFLAGGSRLVVARKRI